MCAIFCIVAMKIPTNSIDLNEFNKDMLRGFMFGYFLPGDHKGRNVPLRTLRFLKVSCYMIYSKWAY